nr:hypothetical protein Iba_chr01aCG7990 [Ipomoea batatas]
MTSLRNGRSTALPGRKDMRREHGPPQGTASPSSAPDRTRGGSLSGVKRAHSTQPEVESAIPRGTTANQAGDYSRVVFPPQNAKQGSFRVNRSVGRKNLRNTPAAHRGVGGREYLLDSHAKWGVRPSSSERRFSQGSGKENRCKNRGALVLERESYGVAPEEGVRRSWRLRRRQIAGVMSWSKGCRYVAPCVCIAG